MGGRWWRVAADARDQVGEGPVWIASENALYWTDVLGPAVNRLSLVDGSTRRWAMPEPTGFVAPRRDHAGFIAGLQSGFYTLQLDPFLLEPVADPEPDRPGNRLNDGKVDGRGRLWAGTMALDGKTAAGALYRLDPDLRWLRLDDGYCGTNGPAFSPAQDRLYHADTPRRIIHQFDLDDAGALHGKRPFVQFPDDWGYPDGMTTDIEGCLWVAHWGGGRISRFDPDGRLDRAIALPASQITSCAFGGPALDRLFVTSAALDRPSEPMAGALFELAPDVRGLPPSAFAG